MNALGVDSGYSLLPWLAVAAVVGAACALWAARWYFTNKIDVLKMQLTRVDASRNLAEELLAQARRQVQTLQDQARGGFKASPATPESTAAIRRALWIDVPDVVKAREWAFADTEILEE
jgi:hypothetical protein